MAFLALTLSVLALPATALPAPAATSTQNTLFAQNWESGIGSWFADNGVWEVGLPTSGPNNAVQGTQCAATVLAGNYPAGANSRLISPAIVLPASPLDGRLELRFWHWFSIVGSDNDSAWVEVSTTGTAGPWFRISNVFTNASGGWGQYIADLSAYAGQTVRIAFHLRDMVVGFTNDVGPGWYVDDLVVTEGRSRWISPEGFDDLPGYPPTIGGWFADRGVWQIGSPTTGPKAAYRSRYCAATVLDGSYPQGSDSRLVSPSIALEATPQDGQLWLSFWHWFDIVGSDTDSAWVEISTGGSLGPWTRLSSVFTNGSGGWTQYVVDLSTYAGQTIRIGFRIKDGVASFTNDVASGWYIDNPSITSGRMILDNPEGFERGTRGWFADGGVWQMGVPSVGPPGAHTGTRCAGTVLDGNYPTDADSRLIMPSFIVPAGSPDLRFWHWFSLVGSDADSAWVELSTVGPRGPWGRISNVFTNSSGGWTQYIADLSQWIGQTVWIGFRIKDRVVGFTNDVAPGWYLDDVQIDGLPTGNPNAPTFTFADFTAAGAPILHWTNPSGAFDRIAIYVGRFFDFEPDLGNRVLLATGTSFTDVDRPGTDHDYMIAAVDANRHESTIVRPVAATAVEPGAPHDSRLSVSASPNPFQEGTEIAFSLPEAGRVRLEIVALDGRRVAVLVDRAMEAGRHACRFDRRDLAAGMYFYRLFTTGEVRTGKLVRIR